MVPQGLAPSNDPLPQSVAIQASRCRGSATAAAAPALRPMLAALPSTAGLDEVKRSTVRTVLRGSSQGLDFHLKLYRAATLSDRARDSLLGDRASKEARNLLSAARLGLPAVTPLACGSVDAEDGHGVQSFLVTRTVAGAAPFSFALPDAALRAVGELLRAVHDRGLLPGDLHPGNLVLDQELSPWLLDLSSLRHGGEPTLRQRANGLAAFCSPLDGGPCDPAAVPLLTAYLEAGAPLPESFPERLAQEARAARSRGLPAFGRRASRPCRHTAVPKRRRGGFAWQLHLVEDEADREPLHEACRAFVEAPPQPDKSGRRGAVWLLPEVAVKRREQGQARRLFAAAYWLLYAGVPQAEPVAMCSKHDAAYVFARRIPSPSLHEELQSGSLSATEVLATARGLGQAVGRLHAHGLRNRDLKFENLVRDPVTGTACVVDLDGISRKRPDDSRGQGRDLGRLLAAHRAAGAPGGVAAAIAFLRAYLRQRQQLLQPAPARRVLRAARKRAQEWASAHRG